MNIIGTTAIPTENLSGIEVLNGLASSLYGAELSMRAILTYRRTNPAHHPCLVLHSCAHSAAMVRASACRCLSLRDLSS
jgi:hypothetical protein